MRFENVSNLFIGFLVEKLDHMSGATPTVVEAQDMSCQTDFQPITTKSRLTPIGAVAVAPPAINQQQQQQLQSLTAKPAAEPVDVTTATNNPTVQTVVAATVVNAKGQNLLAKEHQVNAQIRPPNAVKQQIVDSSQLGKNAVVPLSSENEHKLLKLITEESKASLNSIKDTLERLVSLAQGGDSPSQAAPPLSFDLNQLPPLNKQIIKTDIIDIPLPASPVVTTLSSTVPPTVKPPIVTTAATQQQNQPVDVNQHMAQIKQIIEFKRRHQSPSIIDDENAAVQRQQFVQTDLSYVPRAPSPITEEDYTLLRHAKEIVENKAEELVSRYSQLIEQSEANRLAETVKKVEKRMKVIF